MLERTHDRAPWRTSSYSNSEGGECVEVALRGTARVRDTTDREGGALNLPLTAWRAFTGALHEV